MANLASAFALCAAADDIPPVVHAAQQLAQPSTTGDT
jgi:hypothetical protein